jgi:hypothetical protein
MKGRLFIDECLSPDLVQLAIAAGHVESTCVRDRGRLGLQDWNLFNYVLEPDFILVTRNVEDFRGAGGDAPGGLYAGAEVHAGLICLTAVPELDIDLQRELFGHALTELTTLPDLVNQALEVHQDQDDNISIVAYDIPRNFAPEA